MNVKWAHHPFEIKAALRLHRIRPSARTCHGNCQRLILAAEELEGRLRYHEGIARSGKLVFEHAWLTLDGHVVDLTLTDCDTTYLAGYEVSRIDIAKAISDERRSFYWFVNPDRLAKMMRATA